MEKYYRLADLLLELEMAMRAANRWQIEIPEKQAFMSVEPFAIDTMTFNQWLKFVMLPRFKQLIESGAALPSQCYIAPMAEEYFKLEDAVNSQPIIQVLQAIDAHLGAG